MVKVISRRGFLGGLVAGFGAGLASPGGAAPPAVSLRPVARSREGAKLLVKGGEQLVAEAGLGGRAATSYAVADLKSGQVLEQGGGAEALPPASVAKAVTALYALEALGPEHRFTTRLIATGPVQGGIVQGDLVLAGGGDPMLDTDALAAMAAELKARGVRGVSGAFRVWGGALPFASEIDTGQPDHVGYNPAVGGLALNYNRVHFEWKRQGNGYGVSMDARSDRYRPAVRMARMSVVNRKAPLYTYAAKGGRDEWTVARAALGNGGSRWLPVRRPEAYAGEVFAALAAAQGVKLGAPQVAKQAPHGTVLVLRHSPDLRVILRLMLKYSTNLTAEMVGLAATAARKGKAGSIRASAAEMTGWAQQRLGMRGARFVDHSGLGEASRVTAAAMVQALSGAARAGLLRPILKDIAMRDAKGRVQKGHPIKVQAKTGTLNFVSGLAGYMTAADGTELAFAVFSADLPRRAGLSAAQRDRPDGAGVFNKRAKQLQQRLIERWGAIYGS